MSQRVIHCASGFDTALAAAGAVTAGDYAGGTVAALSDDAALSLLARGPGVVLLYFSKESFDHALRKLDEPAREAAIRQRKQNWSPDAASEGAAWLVGGERRCLSLASVEGGARPERIEATLQALHMLVNEGAYGSVLLPAMLVYVLQREALLIAELALGGAGNIAAQHRQLIHGLAAELAGVGRPEFMESPLEIEALRAAFVSPADDALRTSRQTRRMAYVDWKDGLVSAFGTRDLTELQRRRKVQVLYPNGRQFLQDLEDLSEPQLFREFEERLAAGPMPFWLDHLNFLRLDTALMRRAAYEKASAENSRVAAALRSQIPVETSLLSAALAEHPSWLNGEYGPAQARLALAEAQVREDAAFLTRFARLRGSESVQRSYESYGQFKAAHRQP